MLLSMAIEEDMMKTLVVVGAVLTVLMLVSTIICGLWIQSRGLPADPDSLRFHMLFGLATALVSIVTVVAASAAVARPA